MNGDYREDAVEHPEQGISEETQASVPIEHTTQKLDDKAKDALGDDLDPSLFRPGTILFYLSGGEQPVLFQDAEKITLGRLREIDEGEMLDLDPYDGAAKGVSRQHAAVHLLPNGYFLEDLRSTNGTWLNAERLKPLTRYELHNGDHIQMGEFTLNVYFSEVEEVVATQMLQLIPAESATTPKRFKLTLDFLQNEVLVYLQAMAKIQELATDESRETSAQVQSIRLSNDQQRVQIEITVMNQARQIIQQDLLPIRQAHMEDVRMTRHELEDQPTQAMVEAYRQDETAASEYLGAAIDSFIQRVSPNLPRADADTLAHLRLACFTLLVSPLSSTAQ